MPIPYPAGLPSVTQATKRRTKAAAFSVTSPRRGKPYLQRTGTDTPTVWDVTWRLTQAQAVAFKEWFEDDLDGGIEEFYLPIKTEAGLVQITAQFLPDGLLDTTQQGEVWVYSASVFSRTGTGPVITPPAPAPAPVPASPVGYTVDSTRGLVWFLAGSGGAEVTTELLAAAAAARASDYILMLPPWNVSFRQTLECNKIVGTVPGLSKLTPLVPFTYTGFANQFVVINDHFGQSYNSATADEILYDGWELEITPTVKGSLIGLGNVRGGVIKNLVLRANPSLVGVGGKPIPVDSLIDLYAAVKNVEVHSNRLYNVTGAYGTTTISEFGGSCIWIRNLSSNGSVAANVTENNTVHHNYMEHMTSDEVIAIFGVRGTARKNRIHDNIINGLASIGGVYHNTFISIFPLDDGSGANLGDTSAVYENDFYNNVVVDRACLYDVVRIGNSADNDRQCWGNRSWGNRVRSVRSNDPVTGPRAIWVSLGSVGPDPEVASSIFRCIEGTFGLAYFRDTSGNTSESDIAENTGATCGAGFLSWQQVENPTTLGDIFTGVSNCRFVNGGKVEAAFRAFYNCRSVTGTAYRVNGTGGTVFDVDTSTSGVFVLSNTVGETFGRFVRCTGSVASTTRVNAFNNTVAMQVAGYYPLENQSSTGARLRANNNTQTGSAAGITTGVGTINRAGNEWNGTLD